MVDEKTDLQKNWTNEERLALAAKLDDELDAFIDSLEKKRYEEGWPEDRWQEVSNHVLKSLLFYRKVNK